MINYRNFLLACVAFLLRLNVSNEFSLFCSNSDGGQNVLEKLLDLDSLACNFV